MTKYHRQFLKYLVDWQENLGQKKLSEAAPKPERTAIISVDVINGFCTEGVLSSPRVQAIVSPITLLMKTGWEYGIRHIILTQDTHDPAAIEFGSFAPHCIRGSSEADTVPEIKSLPFFDQITIMEKNSIHSGLDTGLTIWTVNHPEVDTFIIVGDCTDLCTYQLGMHLRLEANERQMSRRVIVPADCVATYDIPVDTAEKLGIFAHDGDLLHTIFLYHMAMNGIEVVKQISR